MLSLAPVLFMDSTQPETFSYTVPSIAGTTLGMTVLAVDEGALWVAARLGLAADASGVSLDCPGPPTPLSPSNNQTGVTSATQFSWSAYPEAVYALLLGGLTVYAASTTVTLPDLSSIDFQLSPSTPYTWQVAATSPYASVDDFAAPTTAATQAVTLLCQAQTLTQNFTTSATP
jgi:hypothetical protein